MLLDGSTALTMAFVELVHWVPFLLQSDKQGASLPLVGGGKGEMK